MAPDFTATAFKGSSFNRGSRLDPSQRDLSRSEVRRGNKPSNPPCVLKGITHAKSPTMEYEFICCVVSVEPNCRLWRRRVVGSAG